MNILAATPASVAAIGRRVRVMIVDDALVVRGLFARWVEAEPDLELVASLRTGHEAVNQVERADPDVVVHDIDMPELDGHRGVAVAAGEKARPGRDHGLDADPTKCRDQLEGALVRRRRLHPETIRQPRSHRRCQFPA